jgi:hypothetical protein
MSAAIADWSDFFVAQVGASAALTGLIFVAVALNLERILKYRWLPQRAAHTLVVLGEALVLASLCLMPHQTALVLGIELLVTVALAAIILVLLSTSAGPIAPEYRRHAVANGILLAGAHLPSVAGGALVLADKPAGLYCIAFAILLALALGVFNAWIFLVEIVR